MADQILPAYSTTAYSSIGDSDVPPQVYTVPTQFNIGSQCIPEPLVNISQVKGHLALLHAFVELKKQVEELQEAIPQMPADLEKRWAWFVGLAVERSVSICLPGYFRLHLPFLTADLTFGVTDWERGMRGVVGRRFIHRSMLWWYVVIEMNPKKIHLGDNDRQGLACLYVESYVRAQMATD